MSFLRYFYADCIRLRRSRLLLVVLLFPAFYVMADFAFLTYSALTIKHISPTSNLASTPVRSYLLFWAGGMHSIYLAVLASGCVYLDASNKVLKQLYVMPIKRWILYLFRMSALMLYLLFGLGIIVALMRLEWIIIPRINGQFIILFPWKQLLIGSLWLFLGSLPLLAFYFWLSNRISSPMVAVSFGLVGMILTFSLGNSDINPQWQKDAIPWVLPYSSCRYASESQDARREARLALAMLESKSVQIDSKHDYNREIVSKSGKRYKINFFMPDELIYGPPDTPKWLIFTLSFAGWIVFFSFGAWDLRFPRVN